MRRILLFAYMLMMIVLCKDAKAQHYPTYEYAYDDAGNRIRRIVLVLKESTGKSTGDTIMPIEDVISEDIKMLLYPNPSKGYITLEMENYKDEIGEYSLLDISGRIIDRGTCNSSSMILDMSSYAIGIYLFQVSINDKKCVYKIIKE